MISTIFEYAIERVIAARTSASSALSWVVVVIVFGGSTGGLGSKVGVGVSRVRR